MDEAELAKKARRRRGWKTVRARRVRDPDGSRLAAKVDPPPRRPTRLWTWAVVSHNGCHPYLHVQPQSTRQQAVELASKLNVLHGGHNFLVRRVVYELHLPREAGATPGLPIPRTASALGRL